MRASTPLSWLSMYLLGILILWKTSHGLLLSSFNIQVFGDKKMLKSDVVSVLIRILHRYDFVCIQEIRDTDGDSFEKLVTLLNEQAGSNKYRSVIGERLGKTNSKEQYGIVYRASWFTLEDVRTVPGYQDRMERPPMRAHVHPKKAGVPDFTVLVVHLDPDHVFEEMEWLYEIAGKIKVEGEKNILILGDMNAACGYLSKKKKKQLQFTTDSSYIWLIDDTVDTTVGKRDCAYDRMIVHGEQLKAALLADTARAFRFPEEYHLDSKLAAEVSDHYPIEIEMRSGRSTKGKRN